MPRPDNYALQADHARRIFLTRDQTQILKNAPVTADEDYIRLTFLSQPHRICRRTGHIFRLEGEDWLPADSHGEVLTIFDWLCDARPGRRLTGQWKTNSALSIGIHTDLFKQSTSQLNTAIDRDPARFRRACESLGGRPWPQGDIGYVLPLFDDLPVMLQFWHADEDFPPQLNFFWDSNTLHYLRYETTFFALGLLRQRIFQRMNVNI